MGKSVRTCGDRRLQISDRRMGGTILQSALCNLQSLYCLAVSTPSPFTATGEMLTGFWYRALRSDEVRAKELVPATLLEIPLVLGRTDAGAAFAMRDNCPHRGIPLSYGWFDGKDVQCSYHG